MVINNPNNWHWVDKNCLSWSKEYFQQELAGLGANNNDTSVSIIDVLSVDGDCDVSQRKGKVISLFNLQLTLEWGAADGDVEGKGSIKIPELAYDTEADEIQFDITVYKEDANTTGLRSVVKKLMVPVLREKLAKFGKDLILQNAGDIQLEKDKVSSTFTKSNQTDQSVKKDIKQPSAAASKAAPAKSASSVYNTSSLHIEEQFQTTAEQLYITLLDRDRIAAWSRSVADMPAFPPPPGSEFKMFGGAVSGKIVKEEPNHRIVEHWRLSDWKEGHYATLDITFLEGQGETTLVAKWSGIPVGQEERVRGNFEDYYVRSIKITFGFGAVL